MTAVAPVRFETEATSIGAQTLVTGVAPISQGDRLAFRAAAPMQPKKEQRACDLGLFDTNARNQIEMFNQLPRPSISGGTG